MRHPRPARRHRLAPVATCAMIGMVVAAGCSTSATRTEGAGPIDNVGIQTQTRCTFVKEYQLFLYTADLQITGQNADDGKKLADGLRGAGVKVQGAIPEFGPYVSAITNDRTARLTGAPPPTTTVNLDDARQIVGTYQIANCAEGPTPVAPASVPASVPALVPSSVTPSVPAPGR